MSAGESQSGSDAERDFGGRSEGVAVPDALAKRIDDLRALRSTWGVLAPSAVSKSGHDIAETGRELDQRIGRLLEAAGEPEAPALVELDARLREMSDAMREIVLRLPIAQLRSTLPYAMRMDRQGVLDLLDLVLGPEMQDPTARTSHIPLIDYLITLLCTGGREPSEGIHHDPVALTPRLQAICRGADPEDDPRLAEIEAEFFAAASADDDDLRAEIELRQMRARKAELGTSFFAPRVLRAIVTYNAALLERVADEVWDSRDWGSVLGRAGLSVMSGAEATSVFECVALRDLAHSLRRRAAGEPPGSGDLDRIAWCLDLDYATPGERKILLEGEVGSRDDAKPTVILVGLLCRSLAVLSVELQTIGISADQVSDAWVTELERALKAEVAAKITAASYQDACAISELKSKFLYAPLKEAFREARAALPGPLSQGQPAQPERYARSSEKKQPRESASELVHRALDEQRQAPSSSPGPSDLQAFPWARLMRAAAIAAALAGLVWGLVYLGAPAADLRRFDREELEAFSPYLERGYRNEEGRGRAFVGTIEDGWLELGQTDRARAADELVAALRERGMSQIMIYDDDEQLRIQALGSQPIHTL